jgi:hypothetical protein
MSLAKQRIRYAVELNNQLLRQDWDLETFRGLPVAQVQWVMEVSEIDYRGAARELYTAQTARRAHEAYQTCLGIAATIGQCKAYLSAQ